MQNRLYRGLFGASDGLGLVVGLLLAGYLLGFVAGPSFITCGFGRHGSSLSGFLYREL